MISFEAGRFFIGNENKKYIMGILNVTPDSFSDGGKFFTVSSSLKQAEAMIEDGADIIDIGAVSTRPFSNAVDTEEEWDRLKNILPVLIRSFNVPVSVDTYNPEVAKRCLEAGVDMINDVSGVFQEDMARVVKSYNCGWITMHGGVMLRRAEEEILYQNGVLCDVNNYFSEFLSLAEKWGIRRNSICLDPGFGFSKNSVQNIELLENLDKLDKSDFPLLCALSRKRFIGEISGETIPENRDAATLEANIKAMNKGADIIRVHNVRLHRSAIASY